MSAKKLTSKQAAFVREYLIDYNATQAAIRAGFSEKTARSQGQRMLTNVDIKNAIEERTQKRELKAIRSAEEILEDVQRVKKMAMNTRITNAGDEVMINPVAALKALELEGKHQALWTERQAVDITTGGKPFENTEKLTQDQLDKELEKRGLKPNFAE